MNRLQKKQTRLFFRLMTISYALVILFAMTSCSSTRQCKKLPTYGWYK